MKAAERKRQSAKERKPVILRSFYEVINELGLENASIARVAEKAGVHPSTVIHYFGNKEEMVKALVDETLRKYGRILERLPEDDDPSVRLDRLLTLIWSREWHQAVSFSVIFSLLALSRRDDDVMMRMRNLYRTYRKYLTKQVAFFSQSGIIEVDNQQATVQALISLSEGSHYFNGYHIEKDSHDEHCKYMIWAAKRILGVKEETGQNAGDEYV